MNNFEEYKRMVNDLEEAIGKFTRLPSWEFKQVKGEDDRKEILESEGWEVRRHPITWDRREGTVYLRKIIEIPSEIEGISLQGTNIDLNLLFIRGVEVILDGEKVYQDSFWADTRANYLPFLRNAKTGEKHSLVFRVPQGEGAGGFQASLYIDRIEETLFELKSLLAQFEFGFHLAKWENIPDLERCLREAESLLPLEALQNRKWEEVFARIKEIEKELEKYRNLAKRFKIHLVGHAHIDMNWLWTYENTIETCLNTVSTVLKLMEENPDLTFIQSQAHIYTIIEEKNPRLFEEIRKRVEEGRWCLATNAWVEGDLNLASGESILRHILYARKYIEEKIGKVFPIMWAPDTFGHPISLPTILQASNISYYYFMRGGEGIPLFRWRGREGSEVLAFSSVYNNSIDPHTVFPAFIDYYTRYRIPEMMFIYGVGDHGGGPTKLDIEKKKKLEKKPLLPRLEFSTPDNFFSRIEDKRESLPVIEEELNTVFEGCYTTHADIKKANREGENILCNLEVVSSLASLKGFPYPEKEIEELWRKVLFNQFHDILDGTSIQEAYEYSLNLVEEVKEKAGHLISQAINFLKKENKDKGIILFNPLAWEREELVSFALPPEWENKDFHLEDKEGNKIAVEVKGNRGMFYSGKIPGMGIKNLLFKEGKVSGQSGYIKIEGEKYENPFYILHIDQKTGLIKKLVDKKTGKEIIHPGLLKSGNPYPWTAERGGNLLKIFWEEPHPMSAWCIGSIYRIEHLTKAEDIQVESGTFKTEIKVSRRYQNSHFTQIITLYSHLPYLDFQIEANWQEEGNEKIGVPMLRVHFNFNLDSPQPFFEIPFGVETRSLPGEYPALRWAGLRDRNYWVAVINQDKYGYYIDGRNLSLTLLRNPYDPHSGTDTGYHRISYRLLFGETDEVEITRKGAEFNHPLILEYGECIEEEIPPLKVTGKTLVTCFKKSFKDEGYILRLNEIRGRKEKVRIEFSKPPASIFYTNHLEEPIQEIKIKDPYLDIDLPPFTVISLRIVF